MRCPLYFSKIENFELSLSPLFIGTYGILKRMIITKTLKTNDALNYQSTNNIQKVLIHKRNYGIDLLRIFSMINIINLHINQLAGLLNINSNSTKFKTIWRLETFSYCAVDCFGLISGIVGYNSYKFSNLIYLWFISTFYSVSKHLFIENRSNLKDVLLSFFPILTKFHWYMNAYFIMYLFLPFINFGIKFLSIKTYRNLVCFYISFFSIYYIISSLFQKKDYNFLIRGYSSS